MRFMRRALNFARGLVKYVLEHCSEEHYKPSSPNYRLNWKPRTSGTVVDWADGPLFRPMVGKAVVFLQPLFEDMLDEIDCAVYEQAPEFFEPVKFLRFCSLVTLEMARDYFVKGNHSIPDDTAVFIAQLLCKYHQNCSFRDDEPTWEGKPGSSWAAIYETARSIMNFRLVLLESKGEFVPEVSPPSTPEPVLPSVPVPQCHPLGFPIAQIYYQPLHGVYQLTNVY